MILSKKISKSNRTGIALEKAMKSTGLYIAHGKTSIIQHNANILLYLDLIATPLKPRGFKASSKPIPK